MAVSSASFGHLGWASGAAAAPGIDPQSDLEFFFRPYHRRFRQPLRTSHGLWSERRGIVIRLRSGSGQSGYGEIAPLPWFGTETWEAALAFCQALVGDRHTAAQLMTTLQPPGTATAFALGSALDQLVCGASRPAPPLTDAVFDGPPWQGPRSMCALLPAGASALTAWEPLWSQGHRTFKWKIGVADPIQEQAELRHLRQQLPVTAQLRLDANAGLTLDQAEQWLRVCDALSTPDEWAIEFLEQPLPPAQLEAMLSLAERYRTPLALDESVANLEQLQSCYARGWRGIFVVKAAIAGPPQSLLGFCMSRDLDVVFSSVFETDVGRSAVLSLAQQYAQTREPSKPRRALGLGVAHWLEPDGLNHDCGDCVAHPPMSALALAEAVWLHLGDRR